MRGRLTRWRDDGWFRGSIVIPVALISAFVVVFVWGFTLTYVETGAATTERGIPQRVLATLVMFTGGFIQLGDEPNPPGQLSVVATLALLLTFLTAGSLLLLSRRVRDLFKILLPHASLVIIGEGATAAAIIKTSASRGISTILVTDSAVSESARATKPSTPIIAAGRIDGVLSTPSARRVVQHANHVVVASDSDATNMQLRQRVRPLREFRTSRRAPWDQHSPTHVVVIHDPQYAELLRPLVIREHLPSEEVTCPIENIAEHICHLVVAAVTGWYDASAREDEVTTAVIDVVELDGGDIDRAAATALAPTLRTWLERLDWSLSFLHGKEGANGTGRGAFADIPDLRLRPDGKPLGPKDLLIKIYTGSRPSDVVNAAIVESEPRALRIAVTNTHLVRGATYMRNQGIDAPAPVMTGREWIDAKAPMTRDSSPLLVVDPDEVGLDAALVTDDTGTQWARTFALTHSLMFSDGKFSVTGWQPGAPMGDATRRCERIAEAEITAGRRAAGKALRPEDVAAAVKAARKDIAGRYSSQRAVVHMLELLTERGFELRSHDAGCPPAPPLTERDVEFIAEREHTDWRDRQWPDLSRRFTGVRMDSVSAYSASGAHAYSYVDLTTLIDQDGDLTPELRYAANYNRRIATETYPAIAASFGYAIVKPGAVDDT